MKFTLRVALFAMVVLCPAGMTFAQPEQKPRRQPHRFVEDFYLYRHWLEQDVRWIITKEETAAFKTLTNDEERDQFIEQFWKRRNPTPESFDNQSKLEHYRRLLYAKAHFPEEKPGWASDRAHILVLWGAPDEIETKTVNDGGTARDVEVWHYKNETKIHPAADIRFIDTCSCKEFHLTEESLAVLDKSAAHAPEPVGRVPAKPELFIGIEMPPQVHFKELEEVITHKVKVSGVPLKLEATTQSVTDFTSMVTLRLTAKRSAQTPSMSDASQSREFHYFGMIRSVTGRVVEVFEGSTTVVPNVDAGDTFEVLTRDVPLKKGLYRIEVAVQDAAVDKFGTTTLVFKNLEPEPSSILIH